MKTTITLIAAMLLLLTTGEDALRAQTDVPPAGARYGVKSAIIKKSFYGPGGDREITIYIDDYGAREAEEDRMGKHQSLRIRNEKDKTEVVVDFSERTVNIGGWESKRQINYRHLKLGELERVVRQDLSGVQAKYVVEELHGNGHALRLGGYQSEVRSQV